MKNKTDTIYLGKIIENGVIKTNYDKKIWGKKRSIPRLKEILLMTFYKFIAKLLNG